MKNFQDILIATIKGAGQDLIDHAEEYAGSGEFCTGFKIEINLNPDTDYISYPEIVIHRSYISDTAYRRKWNMISDIESEDPNA